METFGEIFAIIFVGGIVLYTLISGLRAIIITWKYCMAVGSSKEFFHYVMEGTGGNVFVILGILILCIPVYLILSLLIALKK